MGSIKRTRSIWILAGSVLLCIAVIVTLISVFNKKDTPSDGTQPTFSTLLPSGKSIDTLGGWQKMTPPGGEEYYVYTDSLEDVSILVSQQELPDSFRDNTASKVAEMAKAYNATLELRSGTMTIYVGNSAQGPQSVIFVKDGVLVLVKSDKKIQDSAWISYVAQLR